MHVSCVKILFILSDLATGGAEIFVLHLAAGLHKAGHSVSLLLLRGEAFELELIKLHWPEAQLIHCRHPWLPLVMKLDGLLFRLRVDWSFLRLFQIRYLRRVLAQIKPDVVHSHLFSADLVAAIALGASPLPWVSTIHGDYLSYAAACQKPLSHFHRFPERCQLIDRRINQVVLISEPQRKAMAELLPRSYQQGRQQLILNGVPLPTDPSLSGAQRREQRQQLGMQPDSFLIGMVARGIAEKGWDVLIEAFEQVNLPNTELLLVGSGKALDALARQYQTARIHFYGHSNDPQSLIRLCDLTVLPSRYASESCPLVVAESLAVGVPVIASRVGQISWMLDEHTPQPAGRTIPLTEPAQLVRALAAELRNLHANPALLQSWQRHCLQARAKFSIECCAESYLQVYAAAGT